MVKLRILLHIVPHLFVGGVENVRAVYVHVNALDLFCVNISGHVVAFVHDQAGLPTIHRLARKHRAKQTGTDNEIIVAFHS